jgi:hypothetical protein
MKTATTNVYFNLSYEERKNFTGIVKLCHGTITYFKNNKLHREDGPAIIERNQYKEYWINGEQLENCNSDEALRLYIDMLKIKGINYKP